MRAHHVAPRAALALLGALLALPLFAAPSAAQTADPGGSPFLVRVESGASPRGVAGNVTFTGVAVDCATGQPATRVAVYDGVDGPYVADVSMDTMKNVARYCSGRGGSARIGFTLIYDSRKLDNGRHLLAFVAEYPGEGRSITTVPVFIDNFPHSVDGGYYGYFGPSYGYPYVGGYYGGYLGYAGVYPAAYPASYCTAYAANGTCIRYSSTYPYAAYPYYTYPYGGYVYPSYIFPYPGYTPYAPGSVTIVLEQAGQTLPRDTSLSLSGWISCATRSPSTVTLHDVTSGGERLIGTTSTLSSFRMPWDTIGLTGSRTIQVTVVGPCGTRTQSFTVHVA